MVVGVLKGGFFWFFFWGVLGVKRYLSHEKFES